VFLNGSVLRLRLEPVRDALLLVRQPVLLCAPLLCCTVCVLRSSFHVSSLPHFSSLTLCVGLVFIVRIVGLGLLKICRRIVTWGGENERSCCWIDEKENAHEFGLD
jgi:hypothetical protein